MDAALHRIEALPGAGRYAVTFRNPDGTEQAAVVQLAEDDAEDDTEVAEASLPESWRAGETRDQLIAAVRAFDTAAKTTTQGSALRDVEGGWDVSLGNVVLNTAGVPECTAHGPMAEVGTKYECAECGAAAMLGAGG